MGALVLHGHSGRFICHFSPSNDPEFFFFFAAIISFLAAFFLIRHKLAVAEKEEERAEEILIESPKPTSPSDPEKARHSWTVNDLFKDSGIRGRVRVSSSEDQIIWSTNPHLVQVGPFQGQPPTELLSRCYFLCIYLSFFGFLLALIGALSFAWDRLPLSICISTTVLMGICMISGVLILIVPSTSTSHIYWNHKSR